jgi:hypothetical protein
MLKLMLVALSLPGWFFIASWLLIRLAPWLNITLHVTDPWIIFWSIWWQNHQHMEWHINTALWLAGSISLVLVGSALAGLLVLEHRLTGKTPSRQPNLYGKTKWADEHGMAAGGITSEKR